MIDDKTKQAAIDRLRKLTHLANNAASEGEAATAAFQAARLVKKYQLEQLLKDNPDILKHPDEVKKKLKVIESQLFASASMHPKHHYFLYNALRQLFEVEVFSRSNTLLEEDYGTRGTAFFLLGVDEDVFAASMTFDYWRASIEKMLDDQVDMGRVMPQGLVSYRKGAASMILDKVKAQMAKPAPQLEGSQALTLYSKEVVQAAIAKLGLKEGGKVKMNAADLQAYLLGRSDGQKISTNKKPVSTKNRIEEAMSK